MKTFLYASILTLIFSASFLAQENTPCPKLKINASESVALPGQPISFSVALNEWVKNLKLEYKWETSAGNITEGQSTAVIVVDTTGLGGINVSVALEIKGLPQNCVSTFSATTAIRKLPEADHDWYGKLALHAEHARLDQLAVVLSFDKNAEALIIMRFESESERNRIIKIIKYLAQKRGIAKERITFLIHRELSESYTEPRIIRGGEDFPTCENCQIIKGENFKLKKYSKSKKKTPRRGKSS